MKWALLILFFSVAEAKFSLKEELKKEMPLPKAYKVETPIGSLKIPSVDKKIISNTVGNGIQKLESNIGPKQPLTCFITRTSFSGATIHALKNSIFKDLEIIGINQLKVGRGKRSPYTSVNYLYKVPKKSAVGLAKIYISNIYNYNIRCLHNQLGYSKLAEDSFLTLLNSFVPKNGKYDHLRSNEIFRIQTKAGHIGHSQVRKFDLGKGKNLFHNHILLVLKTENKGVVYNDIWDIYEVDKDGKIIKGFYTMKENGVTFNNIILKKGSGDNYKVNGLFRKKRISGRVLFKDGLLSNEKVMEHIKRGIGNKKELKFMAYDANFDPLRALHSKYSILETKNEETKIKYTLEKSHYLLHFKNKEYIGMDYLDQGFPAQFIKLK